MNCEEPKSGVEIEMLVRRPQSGILSLDAHSSGTAVIRSGHLHVPQRIERQGDRRSQRARQTFGNTTTKDKS